jgi:hypothetical protein
MISFPSVSYTDADADTRDDDLTMQSLTLRKFGFVGVETNTR